MLIQVYQFRGYVTPSIRSAALVDEIEVDELPRNLDQFAADNGGDFVQVLQEAAA